MKPFKCESCGSEFELADNVSSFKCTYCGATSMFDVNNLNITHKKSIQSNTQSEFDVKLKNAKFLQNKNKEYYEALQIYKELFEIDNNNLEVLEGLMICITHNFEKENVVGYTLEEDNDFTTYIRLYEKNVKDKNKALAYYKKYEEFRDGFDFPTWTFFLGRLLYKSFVFFFIFLFMIIYLFVFLASR